MALRPVKLVICAVAVAILPALLPATNAKAKKPRTPPSQGSAVNSPGCRGGDLFPCGPVYNGNDYLGYDPDPFIRSQIQRDLGAKYGSPE